ncbi:MAG: hypothetical protein NZ942_00865 [Candidatus Aenigmarchaeota archaeon]|nr:hypothetical protein [Candidatus Aenigmarchaeota archaeon]
MYKKIIFSIVPNLFFFFSLTYLIFSGLSTSKAVSVEFNSFLIFFESLEKADVLKGVLDFILFVFFEAVVPLLPFLFLLGLGFFLTFLFLKEINFYFFVFQLIFLSFILFYTKFSVVFLFSFLGILISSLILVKATEKEKRGFSFTNSLIFKHLHIVIFLLAIGLFLNSYLKFESYRQIPLEANIRFVEKFVPNVKNLEDELKNSQIELVNKTCEEIKSGIVQSYQQFPQNIRENCESVHRSSIFVVDTFKQSAIDQIKSWNMTKEDTRNIITQIFPIVEQGIKATPLILATSFYLLARLEIFFIALLFGFFGLILKPREKKQKDIIKKA